MQYQYKEELPQFIPINYTQAAMNACLILQIKKNRKFHNGEPKSYKTGLKYSSRQCYHKKLLT